MSLLQNGRLDPTVLATHRFGLSDTIEAYDTFADAATTGALKVVLQGSPGGLPDRGARVPAMAVG